MDQLKAMRCFVQVVASGGFRAAADALELPKTTVSKLVAELEEHLAVRLLLRTTRTTALTDEGTQYLEMAKRVLSDLDDVDQNLSADQGSLSGKLRVDMPVTIAYELLVPKLTDFFKAYPKLQLSLGASDQPVDLIEQGVDCALRTGPVPDSRYIARKMVELPNICCAAPSYIAEHGEPKKLEDLATHRAVGFFSARSGHFFPFEFVTDGQVRAVNVPSQLGCNDSNAYARAAVMGMGLVQNTRAVLAPYLSSGALVEVLASCQQPVQEVWAIYPSAKRGSRKIVAFVDWCHQSLQQHTMPAHQAKKKR